MSETTRTSSDKRKRLLSNLARVLITAAGITLVATQVDLDRLWEGLRLANWLAVGGILVVFQLGILIRSVRWRTLLAALGEPPSLLQLVGLYYGGAFFNAFLPTGFGGDVVRVFEIGQDRSADVAVGTVAIDRFSGLFVLFVIALIALPFRLSILPPAIVLTILALCISGIIAWVLLLHTGILASILGWLAERITFVDLSGVVKIAVTIRRLERRAVYLAVAASLAFNVLLIVAYYLMSKAFGIDVSLLTFAVFVPVSSALLLLPSIQGLGVREPVFVLLLGAVGVAPAQALAFSIGIYLLNLSTALVGGLVYVAHTIRSLTRRGAAAASEPGSSSPPKG
jgi:uncharacterized protein (TIRG00374 family)